MSTATVATTASTRRLSEVARHVIYPKGIVSSGWNDVEDQCAEFGDEFDEWQRGAGRVILGRREDGIYAATIGGVTLSIPRQVAKTFLVGRIVFALCVLFPGLKVIWTAHRTRTATNTFKALQGFANRSRVAPHIEHIRTANGEQEIAFRNGSVIMFGAREQGFGRGFDEVDIEVFDEAQILTEKALEDMVAATNQSRHPHGALLFYMGTPPRPSDPGEAFTARREEALSGESEDAVYIECSADPDCDPDDQAQWSKANPSFPHRTPLRSMLRLRKNLTSVEAWLREALGIWDVKSQLDIMPNWLGCGLNVAEDWTPPAPSVIGIAVSIDRAWSSIGACSSGEIPHLGASKRARGTDWVVAEAVRIHDKYGIPVVIAGRGPGASLIQPLKVAGLEPVVAGIDDYQDACADLFDSVEAGTVEHAHYDDLNEAVSVAGWTAGERRVWTRKSGDVSMLEAVTLAKWGAQQAIEYDPLQSIF